MLFVNCVVLPCLWMIAYSYADFQFGKVGFYVDHKVNNFWVRNRPSRDIILMAIILGMIATLMIGAYVEWKKASKQLPSVTSTAPVITPPPSTQPDSVVEPSQDPQSVARRRAIIVKPRDPTQQWQAIPQMAVTTGDRSIGVALGCTVNYEQIMPELSVEDQERAVAHGRSTGLL